MSQLSDRLIRLCVKTNKMNAFKIYSVLCLLFVEPLDARFVLDDYTNDRSNLLEEESHLSLGGKIKLNDDEIIANDILMEFKRREINESFHNPQYFNFSRHYFSYKHEIEKSPVYQIIRRMPKGAALHIHSSMMLGSDYLLNLTYHDHLYACFADDDLKLHFADTVPRRPCSTKWVLLNDLRNTSDDVATFDRELKKYFTLYTEDENEKDADINTVWDKFNKVYRTTKSLICFRPVREEFFYRSLKNFYDDNIMYVEIRSGLHSLYELDGTTHDKIYLAKMYQRVTKKFMDQYPDFVGVKLILTRHRAADIKEVSDSLNLAYNLKKELPDIFAGFDLVGQEDLGKPLKEFIPVLAEVKDEINFFFHGGETNWFGTPTDENLLDAVLLGSKRIGHAYALMKHPTLIAVVYRNDIALEINVISNAVLSLVRDIRNHPLATYLALGMPVVLSSDDPGVWDADPLSHDFYVTFVGVASKRADLRMLKQLALNSIKYSALDQTNKEKLFEIFNRRWDEFIKEIIRDYLNTQTVN